DHLGGSAKCAVGSYASGTGNSACTVCGKGKTTTSAGSSSASACIACSNNTGVSAWETVSWTYSGVSSNSVKNLCTIDTCSAGYTLSSNACGIDTYTITYYDYDDNKTLSLSPSSYKVTSSDITLPTPFKSGKKFVSWHTDSALSESTVVNTIPKGSTGNKTFYAEWEPCPSGYACNGSSVTQCTGNTYAGAGASSCTSCPAATGWEITSAFLEQGGVTDAGGVNSDNMANRVRVKSTEMIHLNAGTYNVSFKNTSAGVTVRGFYQYSSPDDTGTFTAMKSGASLTVSSDVYVRLVFQKSNTSTAITPAEVVSAGATLNKTNAYVISGTATTNHDNVNDCKISCPSGSYVAVAGGVCVPVASGKYVAAKTVAYGSTNSVSSCPATNSGSDSGRATNKTCYYTCPSKTVSNGTATVVSSKVYYTGSAYPTCTYNVTCNKGYSASGSGTANPSCTACPYTVTYNSNKPSNASGTISGTTASSTHTYDTAKALTTNGYKLTGWTSNCADCSIC
ncbi:MAG: InlB B-repeat-containing protein, partial [Alphaproteobacteria bacterium]|nr:InlB B-repeat-containing protein [Alphaproteobacteria bacterium]